MNSVEIVCAGERLQLFAEKAVFWARTSSLLVADMHLGKASAFRHAGIAVPEQVTTTDLQRLTALLRHTTAQRLVVLGDLFHAPTGQSQVLLDAFDAWRRGHRQLQIDLLLGNHDAGIGVLPGSWDIRSSHTLQEPPFVLAHQNVVDSPKFGLFGHVHPAVRCAGMRLPCFYFGRRCGLLPAFGSFTGTYVIHPARSDRVFAAADGEIGEVSNALFVRRRP